MNPEERTGILAAGNWIIDQVKLIDEYPEQDALVVIMGESTGNGGGPYNLLKDLRRIGVKYPLAAQGLVGDDANGRTILEDCATNKFDAKRMAVTDKAPTSYTDVMTVHDTGRRTFFHRSGANALLAEEHFDFADCNARFFYLGYLLLLRTLDQLDDDGLTGAAHVLRRAREAGLRTAVDLVSAQTGEFQRVVEPSLPFVDVLFLNEFEAVRLLDLDPRNEELDLDNMAGSILSMGVRELVVIHLSEGAVACAADGTITRHGSVKLPAEEIKGAVGAGDAFAAGMLHGLHEGLPVNECLVLAVCVAATCLTHETTSGGIATIDDCLALAGRFGFREF